MLLASALIILSSSLCHRNDRMCRPLRRYFAHISKAGQACHWSNPVSRQKFGLGAGGCGTLVITFEKMSLYISASIGPVA